MSEFKFHASKRKFASNNDVAVTLFAGKTFGDVWEEYKLKPEHVNPLIDKDSNPKGIQITINGQNWDIPFSSSLNPDDLMKDDYLNECTFRSGHPYQRKDGVILTDDKGEPLFDEGRVYVNFGKPSGNGWTVDTDDLFGRTKSTKGAATANVA